MKEDPVKRTVSRFVSAFPLVLAMLALVVSPALAHHPTGSATASCDGYDVSGNYVGGSSYRWLDWNVTVTIDGVPEVIAGSWNGVNPGFEIFSRTGSGPHDVMVSGYIKMYNDIFTPAVSADTRTYTRSGSDTEIGVNINYNDYLGDDDRQVVITALNGYNITFVGIDYEGGDGNEATFGPQASPFTYNAPNNEDIDHVTVTVHRDAVAASHAKGALMDTFDDWKPGTGKTFVFDDVNCVPDYQLNLSHIECVAEGVEVHFVLLNVPDGITPGTLTYTYGTIEPGEHTGNVWHYTAILPDGSYDIGEATVVVDGYTVQLHNPHEYAGDYNCLPDEATVDVSVGACSWSEEAGSQTPVTISISGEATVTIEGPGGPYTVSGDDTLNLPPGDYTWSAEAGEGYVITGASNGEFTIEDCTPPSATVEVAVGACSWNEETGSLTEVSFTIDHANVTVEGPGGPYELTGSAALNLGPGSYSYSWVAQEGYIGSGEGNFEVGDCTPDSATVSVDVGVCRWDGESSSTAVTFTLTGEVTVLLIGPDGDQIITGTATLILPPGSYSWSAVADEGYRIVGPAEGSFQLASCEPGDASVLVDLGVCRFENNTSSTLVSFTLTGGITVTLVGSDGFLVEFTESGEFNLPPGHYEWLAVAAEGYEIKGPSEGEFDVATCKPECPTCQCPTCGAPIQETMGESMGIAWFSDTPCTSETCPLFAGQDHNPWVKLWTAIPSSYTEEGVTTPLVTVTTANGEACQVAFFRDGDTIGDFILWGPDGFGDRFRDNVPNSERALHKYSACSIFPSWCDTRLGEDGLGYALWLPGHNTSDWAQFLLNNGFFPDEEFRGTAALEWAADLRENGNEALFNWDGDLNSLPLFPLPPR